MSESVPNLPLEDNGKADPGRPLRAAASSRWKLWHWLISTALLMGVSGLAGHYLHSADPQAAVGASAPSTGEGTTHPATPLPGVIALDRSADGTADVVALGRLMPRGDRVVVAPPFGAGDSRVARLLAREGQHMLPGQAIAELDSLPSLQSALEAATARLAAERAELDRVRANLASALSEASAELERATANLALVQSQANRQRALHARRLVSAAPLEESEAREVLAASERDRARAIWQRQQGADQQADVALAIRKVVVAEQSLAQARADLGRGLVLAPFEGTLITIHSRVGEKPGNEGIASFGDLSAMQAELEVYQTDIGRVKAGQAVLLGSPALDSPLRGTVQGLGLEVERQGVLASDPAANTDARIVRVQVAIDSEDVERASRLTGLDITARIRTSP